MSYRVVYPIATSIDANDFSEAVKKFVKLNHFMNIEQLILTDQYKHMKANVNYYTENNNRKALINLSQMDANAVAAIPPIIGFSSDNPNARYPAGFIAGPSSIGGPAGIIAPAPLMVERPAMIGGPMISGPGALLFGARPVEASDASDEVMKIIDRTVVLKDRSTYPIQKIQNIRDNLYKLYGPSNKTSIIKTEILDDRGNKRIVFKNKKITLNDDDLGYSDLSDIINNLSTPTPATTAMTFGPTAVLTRNKQILPISPVSQVGSPGIMMRRAIPVNMGRGL